MPRCLLLVALLSAFASTAVAQHSDAKLLTDVVTVELDKLDRFDVLSNADVQQALSLEAEKQALGCSAEDCLAEIAGAMGARLVVFGQLGRLEEQYLLTLNLFDSERAASAGRELLDAPDLTGLRMQLPGAIADLVADVEVPEGAEGAERPRVLVLDIVWTDDGAATAPSPEVDEAAGVPWFLVGGGVLGAAGVVGMAVGGGLGYLALVEHDLASDAATTQRDAKDAFDARDGYAVGSTVAWIAGGGLLVVGLGVAAVQFAMGGE